MKLFEVKPTGVKKITDDNVRNEIIRKHKEEGVSTRKLAELYKCSPKCIQTIIKKSKTVMSAVDLAKLID
jgi:Mor family transcriptional regulator